MSARSADVDELRWTSVALVLAFVMTAAAVAIGEDSPGEKLGALEQQALTQAAQSAAEHVVQIETVGGLSQVGELLGSTGATSGVVVAEDGYIVSSAFNFITKPASIIVTLPDGSKHAATIVARDRLRMLVLLKIDVDEAMTVPQAAERDEMRVGQWVVAVGKCYDAVEPNISVGVLSADDRIWGRAVQTDAKVSPVNYGGALVDLRGRVLGVLVPLSNQSSNEMAGAELYDSGIGFAVPLVDIAEQFERMKAGEDLKPGLMGITAKERSLYAGPVVLATCPIRSPAAEAGLKTGDQIVSANGRPIRHQADLKQVLGRLYAGDLVEIVAERSGEQLTASVELTDEVAPYVQPYLGVLLGGPDPQAGTDVRYVFPDSPAEKAGLRAGDRLMAIDGDSLDDADDWRSALVVLEPDQEVQLDWARRGEPQTDTVQLASFIEEYARPGSFPTRWYSQDEAGQEEGGGGEAEETEKEPQLVDVAVPESEMRCRALVPAAIDGVKPGLAVWFPAQPEANDEALKRWSALARQHQFIVLYPAPANQDRWEPAELLTVRKLIDEATRTFDVDRNRVALVGVQTGGTVAYRVAAASRDVVRGVCVADAVIPRRMPVHGNDPIERLSYLLLSDPASDSSKKMAANAKGLQAMMLPVLEKEIDLSSNALPAEAREIVARWCNALDRM